MRTTWRALVLAILAASLVSPLCYASGGGGYVLIGDGPLVLQPATVAPLVVTVNGVSDLYSIEMHLRFDPSVVAVFDVAPNVPGIQSQPGSYLAGARVTRNRADNRAGTIDFWATSIRSDGPRMDSDILFVVYFCGLAPGVSPVADTGSWFTSSWGQNLDVTVVDGQDSVTEAGPGGPGTAGEPQTRCQARTEPILVPSATPSCGACAGIAPRTALTPAATGTASSAGQAGAQGPATQTGARTATVIAGAAAARTPAAPTLAPGGLVTGTAVLAATPPATVVANTAAARTPAAPTLAPGGLVTGTAVLAATPSAPVTLAATQPVVAGAPTRPTTIAAPGGTVGVSTAQPAGPARTAQPGGSAVLTGTLASRTVQPAETAQAGIAAGGTGTPAAALTANATSGQVARQAGTPVAESTRTSQGAGPSAGGTAPSGGLGPLAIAAIVAGIVAFGIIGWRVWATRRRV